MEVKRINAKDTYNLRNKLLRPGKDIEECIFTGDEDDQTFHLGAFEEGRLVSVASFFYNKNQMIAEENQYQLRGMATLPNFRGRGLSKELLKVAFPMVKQNFCNVVWCNARTSAQGFYEKTGFQPVDDKVFEIPDVGPHVLMCRKLD